MQVSVTSYHSFSFTFPRWLGWAQKGGGKGEEGRKSSRRRQREREYDSGGGVHWGWRESPEAMASWCTYILPQLEVFGWEVRFPLGIGGIGVKKFF